MQHNKLLVVGELNVDLLLNHIEGFPKIATEIIAHDMNLILGSSSAIMAANCAALGASTTFCGKVDLIFSVVLLLKNYNKKG